MIQEHGMRTIELYIDNYHIHIKKKSDWMQLIDKRLEMGGKKGKNGGWEGRVGGGLERRKEIS